MKKFIFSLAIVSMLANLPASATGLFYTNATYPMEATGVKLTRDNYCLRKGQASATNILSIAEFGNAGVSAAARNGNIRQVYFIDMHEKSIFIFYRKITTTVYGE